MITESKVKNLAKLVHRLTMNLRDESGLDAPQRRKLIAVKRNDDTLQLWSQAFVFETSANEVASEVLNSAVPPDEAGPELERLLGDRELTTESWQKLLTGPKLPVFASRTDRPFGFDDSSNIECVVLQAESGTLRRVVSAEIYDFFQSELLDPKFYVHDATIDTVDGAQPAPVSVWDGDQLVGALGCIMTKQDDGTYAYE